LNLIAHNSDVGRVVKAFGAKVKIERNGNNRAFLLQPRNKKHLVSQGHYNNILLFFY